MNGPGRHAISADYVFDGAVLHKDAAVVIECDRIARIVSRGETEGLPASALPQGAWLAPGFVDAQVNGGGDVLFNDAPTAQSISTIAAAHRKFGTTSFLVTLITDAPEKTPQAIAAVQEAMRTEPSVLGLHLEGPFISPEKAGVHDPRFIRRPTDADIQTIAVWRDGVLLVTLAPERVPAGFIAQLVKRGIRVSLGHSMASYEETRAAIAEGLSGFTHLFNAMRGMESREPGPIAAALETADCSYGLIVDAVHVAPAMLQLALRGLGHPMLVTDAMPPVGGGRSSFQLYGNEIRVADGRCVRSDGTLAGAFLDMATAVRNCVRLLGLSLEQALPLATINPAHFLGVDVGQLTAGSRADMVALESNTVEVIDTWVAGQSAAEQEPPPARRR
jgi:N-acetylglucosamine-6-phosphate deacetylase